MSQPKLLLAHHCLYKVIFPTTHKGLLLAPDKQIKAQMPVLKASADSSPDKTRNQILKGKLVGPSTKHSAWWRSAASPKPRPPKPGLESATVLVFHWVKSCWKSIGLDFSHSGYVAVYEAKVWEFV